MGLFGNKEVKRIEQAPAVQQPVAQEQPAVPQIPPIQTNTYVARVVCDNCGVEQEVQIDKGKYVEDGIKKVDCFNCGVRELKKVEK